MQQSFYGEIYASGYDKGGDRQYILDYYLNQWHQTSKATPILEPMCGTGYFLSAFAEAGADIDGIDASPHMLKICQSKLETKETKGQLFQQNIEDLSLPRQYGFIYIPDRGLSHIYDKELAQTCLQKLHEHLLPNGTFVLDVRPLPPEGEFGKPGETNIKVRDALDGSTLFCTSVWSQRDSGRVIRNTMKFEQFQNSELISTEFFDYNERFYDKEEFQAMLSSAGFINIKTTKAYDNTEPQGHDSIVFSCQKPA